MAAKSEKLWNKDYTLIFFICAIASITNYGLTTFLPVHVNNLGADNSVTGMMVTGLTIAGIITRMIVGPLIDKWGRKNMVMLGAGAFALNAVMYCFVDSVTGVFVLRVLQGVSQGIFFPVPPTIVADVSPKDKLVQGLGFFGISSSLTYALITLVGDGIYRRGTTLFFAVMAASAIIAFILTFFLSDDRKRHAEAMRAQQPENTQKKGLSLTQIFEFSIIIPTALSFIMSISASAVTNYLATMGSESARNIGNITIFFTIQNIAVIFGRLFVNSFYRRIGKLQLTIIGIGLTIASLVLLAFSHGMPMIVVSAVIYGIGNAFYVQILQTIMLEIAPQSRMGAANSTYMLGADIGVGVGGFIWGVVTTSGTSASFTSCFMLSAAVSVAALLGTVFFLIPKYRKMGLDNRR